MPEQLRVVGLLQAVVLGQLGANGAAATAPRAAATFSVLMAELAERWTAAARQREAALGERVQASAGREEQIRSQLAEISEDLRCVLDATVNGIAVMDRHGCLRFVNRRLISFFNFSADSLLGEDVREALLPVIRERVDAPEMFEERSRYFYDHQDDEYRDELLLTVGEEQRILVRNGGPIRSSSGDLVGQVEIYTDVTAQRRAEQVKDEFLSIAAHELKTPITSLKGYAQLLQRAALRNQVGLNHEQLAERLSAMLRQIDRLTTLVNDLLEVSRIQTGRLELRPEVIEMGEVVEHVIDRFRADPALSANHEIEVREVKRALTGYWDSGRLDQVLTNLLGNAVKYSPGGGVILVRLGRSGDMAKVSVSDQGIGIPKSDVEKLFQPFARAANANVRNFTGIGLGLFISRDIIERMGGQIWVDSQEGKGSTFHFTLPLRRRAGDTEREDEPAGDNEAVP